VEVLQCPSNDIATLLAEQDVDFGFLSFTPTQHDLVSRLLFRDELILVVPPSHPLARTKSVVLPQLGTEKFVGHLARTPSRNHLVDLFAREGVPLDLVMELSSLETVKDFVKGGDGVAILPRMACTRELEAGELCSPQVRGMCIGRDIRVSYPRTRTHSPAAAAFLALLARQFPGAQPPPAETASGREAV